MGKAAVLAAALLLLAGCGGGGAPGDSGTRGPVSLGESREDQGPYTAPPFADAVFHRDLAEGEEGVLLDLSAVSEGYVGVSAESGDRLKFQVLKDDVTYNYDIASDGTPSVFPLTGGDGTYQFRVMENVGDSRYAELLARSCDVTLADEFQPFLRPSDYVDYGPDSRCVDKAGELAQTAGDSLGLVSRVFAFICEDVTYDTEKARQVESGYLPDPDRTMAEGRGICFDYAALAAAMLRSQGIPTKMVFGYVSPEDTYHAWNMFYTEETGWVTVSYEVRSDSWNRLDLTFSANGADGEFIGDGGNYSDLYYY